MQIHLPDIPRFVDDFKRNLHEFIETWHREFFDTKDHSTLGDNGISTPTASVSSSSLTIQQSHNEQVHFPERKTFTRIATLLSAATIQASDIIIEHTYLIDRHAMFNLFCNYTS